MGYVEALYANVNHYGFWAFQTFGRICEDNCVGDFHKFNHLCEGVCLIHVILTLSACGGGVRAAVPDTTSATTTGEAGE